MSPTGSAVYGTNMATSGNAYGVVGQSLSMTGAGVYGWASSTTGNDSGVVGQTDSTTNYASGVFGVATSPNGGQTYGVVGSTNSTTQNASGVYGNTGASTTGSTNGVFGTSGSKNGTGVFGTATSTDTSGFGYGVYGTSANGTSVSACWAPRSFVLRSVTALQRQRLPVPTPYTPSIPEPVAMRMAFTRRPTARRGWQGSLTTAAAVTSWSAS